MWRDLLSPVCLNCLKKEKRKASVTSIENPGDCIHCYRHFVNQNQSIKKTDGIYSDPSTLLKLVNNRKFLVSTHPGDMQTHTSILLRSTMADYCHGNWFTDTELCVLLSLVAAAVCMLVWLCQQFVLLVVCRGEKRFPLLCLALQFTEERRLTQETLSLTPLSLALSVSLCYLHLGESNKKVLLDWTMRSYTHPQAKI